MSINFKEIFIFVNQNVNQNIIERSIINNVKPCNYYKINMSIKILNSGKFYKIINQYACKVLL